MSALLTNQAVEPGPPIPDHENEQIECLSPPGVDQGEIGKILTQPESIEFDETLERAQYEIFTEIIGTNPRNILNYENVNGGKDLTVSLIIIFKYYIENIPNPKNNLTNLCFGTLYDVCCIHFLL